MDRQELEDIANDIIPLAMKERKNKDVDMARSYFALCYGFNDILNREYFKILCHRHLVHTGLTEYGAQDYEKKGIKSAQKVMRIMGLFEEWEKGGGDLDDFRESFGG